MCAASNMGAGQYGTGNGMICNCAAFKYGRFSHHVIEDMERALIVICGCGKHWSVTRNAAGKLTVSGLPSTMSQHLRRWHYLRYYEEGTDLDGDLALRSDISRWGNSAYG